MIRITSVVLMLGLIGLADAAHAAGDAAAGQAKATTCGMCHGPTGGGTQVGPRIAGMDTARFVAALHDYKSGKRDNPMMKAQTAQLGDDDMANLAAYYATLK